MTEPRQIATVRDAQEAQSAFRERAEDLKIPREVLDELTGLPKGYSGKVLANPPAKGLGHLSFWTLLGALGLAVVLVEDERRMKRVDATTKRKGNYPEARNYRNAKALSMMHEKARTRGKMGAKARMVKLTPAQRSRIARNAANARWRAERRRSHGIGTLPAAAPLAPAPARSRRQYSGTGARKARSAAPSHAMPV